MKRIIKIILLSFSILLLMTLLIFGILVSDKITTMFSINEIGKGLYSMNYKEDYHLDKALNSNIKDVNGLINFIGNEMYFGYKPNLNISKFGCSAFITKTPENINLVGRNFDFSNFTDVLCVYTHPVAGYQSISTVQTDMLGVGGLNNISTTSFLGRLALLAAPYMGVDGMNEKGLSVSLLNTDYTSTLHMNTEKPDIFISVAVRLLLDKAATVDEAINILSKYDMNTAVSSTQHIFIGDSNGDYAVIEWINEKMQIVKYPVVTNFIMSKLDRSEYKNNCNRFDFLDDSLNNKPINNIDESMDLLNGARQSTTQWSVVFSLNEFKAHYVINRKFNNIYHLNPRTF